MIIYEYSHLSCLEPISIPDPFDKEVLIDESIMEVMTLDEMSWDDHHHRSSFLHCLDKIENNFSSVFSSEVVTNPQCPIASLSFDSEKNIGNISATVPIDILVKPRITEKYSYRSFFFL